MAYTIQRKETKILSSAQLDGGLSYHGKPVMQVESESDNMISAADITDLQLPDELRSRMFAHQIEGVQWLYGLHFSHP